MEQRGIFRRESEMKEALETVGRLLRLPDARIGDTSSGTIWPLSIMWKSAIC